MRTSLRSFSSVAVTRITRLVVGESLNAQDDRILPITRAVGAIIAVVLIAAFVILYALPHRTTELFAWTINPPMTPIVMGAGYGVGVYYFSRVVTVREWHRVTHVFPGIAAFTWFMAIATFLHWENFNHDHTSFLLWTGLYVISPLLVPGIWLLNRRTDPRSIPEHSAIVPPKVRMLARITGVAITVVAIGLFVVPDPLMSYWPWTVSPLTARVLLGWFVLFGVVNIAVSFDPRWSAMKIPVQTQVIGFGLVLIGALRAWDDFDQSNPLTLVFIIGFAMYLAALITLYVVIERR